MTRFQFEARIPARQFRTYRCAGLVPGAVAEDKLSRKSVEEAVSQNEKAAAEVQVSTA